jgi:hypothetical protein
MFLWFVGTAIATVWFVFRDPRFDYRLLVVGSVLPLLDALFGGARVMHTLVFSLALLVAVMLLTVGRRPARRLWLGVAIGTLLHLVFDGAWTNTDVFWWPFTGASLPDGALLPAAGIVVLEELAGLAACAWIVYRFGLADRRRRDDFLRSGRLRAPASP